MDHLGNTALLEANVIGPEEHLRTLGALGHLAAALLMLIGRISVTPLLVTLGGVGEPMQREIRRWRLTRHEKAVR